MQQATETSFVNAFIVRKKRERYLYLLSSSKRRKKLLDQLYHCPDIDPTFVREVKATGEPYHAVVEEQLRNAGAPEKCYVISTDENHDGLVLRLHDVLEEYEAGSAMLISCIPGHLGCFIDEYMTGSWSGEMSMWPDERRGGSISRGTIPSGRKGRFFFCSPETEGGWARILVPYWQFGGSFPCD